MYMRILKTTTNFAFQWLLRIHDNTYKVYTTLILNGGETGKKYLHITQVLQSKTGAHEQFTFYHNICRYHMYTYKFTDRERGGIM